MKSLQLYRSAIEDRVDKIVHDLDVDTHEAFLRLVFYLTTGWEYEELEAEDITDGHGEYQIDALHIDNNTSQEQAIITVIQGTYSESLSSTKLIKLHAGLNYLFFQPKSQYNALSNEMLRTKIQEFRSLRDEILAPNIRVQCYYACLNDTSKASSEFLEQIRRIESDYGDATGGEFEFAVLGPAELYNLMNRLERKGTKVTEKLKILYDRNKGSLLENSIEGVSGVICTVTAEEIARIVNTHPTVFDDNLRRFLGTGGVNKEIRKSCASQNTAPLFWFLNNGITIVCDHFEPNKDLDNPFIRIENLQIVNGCQTATTIAKAQEANHLQPSTKVMVRIFKPESPDLASRLVVTTNTQNKITSRILRARDEIQQHIQAEFERRFSLFYERTPNEFADRSRFDQMQVISNEAIGQAFLAIRRGRSSDASRRKYKIWGEEYTNIFNRDVFPEIYLLVYLIAEESKAYKRQKLRELQGTGIKRILVANGVYHLSRMACLFWRQTIHWDDLRRIREEIQEVQRNPDVLKTHFENSLTILEEIFQNKPEYLEEPSIVMKSSTLDQEIGSRVVPMLTSTSIKRKKTRH